MKFSKHDLLLDLLLIKNITNKIFTPNIKNYHIIGEVDLYNFIINKRTLIGNKIANGLTEKLKNHFEITVLHKHSTSDIIEYIKENCYINLSFSDNLIKYNISRINLLPLLSTINNDKNIPINTAYLMVGNNHSSKDNFQQININPHDISKIMNSTISSGLPKVSYWRKMRQSIIDKTISSNNNIKELLDNISPEDLKVFLDIHSTNWWLYFTDQLDYKIYSLENHNILEVVWSKYFSKHFSEDSSIKKLLDFVSKTSYSVFEEDVINSYIDVSVDYILNKQSSEKKKRKQLSLKKSIVKYENENLNNILDVIHEYAHKTTNYLGNKKYKMYLETVENDNSALKTKNSVCKVHKLIFNNYSIDEAFPVYSVFRVEFHFNQNVNGDIVLNEYCVFDGTQRLHKVRSKIHNGLMKDAKFTENILINIIDKHIKNMHESLKLSQKVWYSRLHNTFLKRLNIKLS